MKKIKVILSLITALCVTSPIAAFAGEKIPAYMTPGTVIQYDADKNMKIVREGTIQTNTSQPEYTSEDLSYLPDIEANMTVNYDALGGPIVVVNSNPELQEKKAEMILPYVGAKNIMQYFYDTISQK